MWTMRRKGLLIVFMIVVCAGISVRAGLTRVKEAEAGSPALTIYNQQFAVVRQTIPMSLKQGANHVEVTDITGHVEPDSVIINPTTDDVLVKFATPQSGTIVLSAAGAAHRETPA